MPTAHSARSPATGVSRSLRGAVVLSAVLGIAIGLVAIFWPGATLLTTAWLFGIALVVGGLYRLVLATELGGRLRWVILLIGVPVLIAGVLVLVQPGIAVLIFAVLLAIAWLSSGVQDLVLAVKSTRSGRGWSAVSGGVSILAGLVVLFLPLAALETVTVLAGVLLVTVSVVGLLNLRQSARSTG